MTLKNALNPQESPPVSVEPSPARRNMRYEPEPDGQGTSLTTPKGETLAGVMANESYSGVAVRLAAATGLELGQHVLVQYYGYPVAGTVRRLAQQPDGQWLVGVEWK